MGNEQSCSSDNAKLSESDSIDASKRIQIDPQAFMMSSDERTPFAKQPHHTSTTFINHACYTIGENLYGQQGDGTTNASNKHLTMMGKLPNDIYINDIIVGRLGSVYMICDNYENLITFGNNGDGQLMIGTKSKQLLYSWCMNKSVPIEIADILISYTFNEPIQEIQSIPIIPLYFKLKIDDKIKLMSTGIDSSHSFILTESNKLYGIGYNKYMQLGVETKDDINDYRVSTLVKVNYFKLNEIRIKKIACNQLNSIFLSIYGEMYWCGAVRSSNGNTKGQLRKLECIYNIKDIDCNKYNLLAVDSAKRIYYAPFSINGLTISKSKYFKEKKIQIVQIKCGLLHNVILDNNGLIYSFGNNEYSQCGINKNETFKFEKPSCIDIKNKNTVIVDIKCGGFHNVVKTKSNEYYLWGRNHCQQCLVYDGREIVIEPRKYESRQDIGAGYDIIAIYPGFNETKVVVKHKNMY